MGRSLAYPGPLWRGSRRLAGAPPVGDSYGSLRLSQHLLCLHKRYPETVSCNQTRIHIERGHPPVLSKPPHQTWYKPNRCLTVGAKLRSSGPPHIVPHMDDVLDIALCNCRMNEPGQQTTQQVLNRQPKNDGVEPYVSDNS
jgi:hypothetical protein